jgi:hypothetical protein
MQVEQISTAGHIQQGGHPISTPGTVRDRWFSSLPHLGLSFPLLGKGEGIGYMVPNILSSSGNVSRKVTFWGHRFENWIKTMVSPGRGGAHL